MNTQQREWEVIAAAVHGALLALHLLGLFYNLRRRNRADSIVHGLACIYDGACVVKHIRDAHP